MGLLRSIFGGRREERIPTPGPDGLYGYSLPEKYLETFIISKYGVLFDQAVNSNKPPLSAKEALNAVSQPLRYLRVSAQKPDDSEKKNFVAWTDTTLPKSSRQLVLARAFLARSKTPDGEIIIVFDFVEPYGNGSMKYDKFALVVTSRGVTLKSENPVENWEPVWTQVIVKLLGKQWQEL